MQAVRRCFHCLQPVVLLQQVGATKVVHESTELTMSSKPHIHAARSMTPEEAVNQAADKYMLDPRAIAALVERHSQVDTEANSSGEVTI